MRRDIVYIPAEVISRLPSGKVQVKLVSSDTDGLKPFYTDAEDLITAPVSIDYQTRYMGRPAHEYSVEMHLDDKALKRFIDKVNERGYQVLSMTQDGDLFSVLYRRHSSYG